MTPVGPYSVRIDNRTDADRMAILIANKMRDPCVILYPRNIEAKKPVTMSLQSAQQLRDDLNEAITWLLKE